MPLEEDHTEATLAARIIAEVHRTYTEAVALVTSGAYNIVGRTVVRQA